jgi:PII-like signaling protein
MKTECAAKLLTIYVGENDTWRSGPLYAALVERLKEAGLDGVTVMHGVEGFGSHHKVHTARFEVLFDSLPVVIEAVDCQEKIEAVLPIVEEMVQEGLATVTDVWAIRYRKSDG